MSEVPDCLGVNCTFLQEAERKGYGAIAKECCEESRCILTLPSQLIECPVVARMARLTLLADPIPDTLDEVKW